MNFNITLKNVKLGKIIIPFLLFYCFSCKTPITLYVITKPNIDIDSSISFIIGDFKSDTIKNINNSIISQITFNFQKSDFKEVTTLNKILIENHSNPDKIINLNQDSIIAIIKKKYPKSLFLQGKVLSNEILMRKFSKSDTPLWIKNTLIILFNIIDVSNSKILLNEVYISKNEGSPEHYQENFNSNVNNIVNNLTNQFIPIDIPVTIYFLNNSEIMGLDNVLNYLKNGKVTEAEKLLKQISEAKYKSMKAKIISLYNYGIFLNYNGKNDLAIQTLKKALELSPNNNEIINAINIASKKTYISITTVK